MATGDRNRAIAYLMRNFGMLDGDVDAVLSLYFRQCSLLVTCRDLAIAAATLANGGSNPIIGRTGDSGTPRRARAQRDADLRHVRLRGRVGLRGGPAREERRLGRRHRGAPRPDRNRRVLTAARRSAATACAASRCAAGSRVTSPCTRIAHVRPPPTSCAGATPGIASAPRSCARSRSATRSRSTATRSSSSSCRATSTSPTPSSWCAKFSRASTTRGSSCSTASALGRIDPPAITLLIGLADTIPSTGRGPRHRRVPDGGRWRRSISVPSPRPTSTTRWSGGRNRS